MNEKKLNTTILLGILIVCIVGVFALGDLLKMTKEIKSDYDEFEKRLEKVEKEWVAIEDITSKITILAPYIKDNQKKKLGYYIHYYGRKYPSIDQNIINIMACLPSVESTYYKYAVGLAGERGYYQIHPIHLSEFNSETIHLAYEERYQVKKAYEILMRNVKKHKAIKYAVNGYNGWASSKNPYFDKVELELEKIENI